MSKIGDYIRKWRTGQRLTLEQAANIFLVSDRTLQKWEKGVNMPAYDSIKILKETMGCRWEDLF